MRRKPAPILSSSSSPSAFSFFFFSVLCTSHLFNYQIAAQLPPNSTTTLGNSNRNNSITNNNSTLLLPSLLNQTNHNQTLLNNSNTSPQTNNSSNTTATSSSNSSTTRLNPLLNNDEAVPLDTKITAPFSILGVLLIISGAPMAFWGGRNRWSSYFLTGAYVAALIVLIPILRFGVIEQDHKPSNLIQGIFVLACLISAIAAGAVAVIFWKGTRFIVGGAGGFVISLFILSLKSNSLIPATGLRWVVILIGITLGFVLATIPTLSIHVTLFATAAMGSAAVVLGIDCFTTAGLKEFWLYIVGFGALFPKLTYFPFTVTMQAELGVMGGIFLMGAAIQWRLLEIIKKKINQLKQLDAERKLQEDAAAYRQSMALDADLALWEKRYGDDGDSMTMTMAASPSKPHHSRKSSQFSLLPLVSPSPNTALQSKFEDSPGFGDRLPSIDSGLGLAGSLGIAEENSDPDRQSEMLNVQTLEATPRTSVLPHSRQLPTHRTQSQPQATSPAIPSINFEQSENDRRFSRPPGAPSSWTRSISVSKLTPKNSSPISVSNSRLPPSSPQLMRTPPPGYPQFDKPQEEPMCNVRSRTTSEQQRRPPSEFLPQPTPQRREPNSRSIESKPITDTKRHSEVPSRFVIGSYQTPASRSSPPRKRESSMMTVEELEHRHKLAIKKIQLPATERVASSSTDHRRLSKHNESQPNQPLHSVNLKTQPPHNHAVRTSTHLTSVRASQLPHSQPNKSSSSSKSRHLALGSNPLDSNNNDNILKSKSSNGWLNY